MGCEMALQNVEDVYPLTPTQQGILYHMVQQGRGGTYFEQFCYTVAGDLDVTAFRAAWQRVVDRHGVLRTAFIWRGIDDAVQVVRGQAALPWLDQDWSALSDGDARARLDRYLAQDRKQGFALEKAPLMRCALFRLGGDRYHFVWSFHHLLMDGWSFSLVLKEVNALYTAFSHAQPDPLGEPSAYGTFIAWQRARDGAGAKAYWEQALADLEGGTALAPALPGGKSEPTVTGTRLPSEVALVLDEATTTRMQQLARASRTTLNAVLQAAWAILLARHTGQVDVCFGYGTSSRNPAIPGVEDTVGMLMATLPMRVRVAGDRLLGALLHDLADRLAAQEEWNFPALPDIQRWAGIDSKATLFDTAIAFENYPMDEGLAVGFCGLDIETLQFYEQTTFPLAVFSSPGRTLTVRLQYDHAAIAHEQADHVRQRLRQLLLALSDASGETPIGSLSMLPPAELHRITAALTPDRVAPAHPASVVLAMAEQARLRPNAVAIVDGDTQITFAELVDSADRLAATLVSRGAGPGQRVVLNLPRSADLVVASLATMKTGSAYVPLDPDSPLARNAMIVDDADPVLVITRDPAIAGDRVWLPPDPTANGADTSAAAAPINGDDVVYVMYTSGSTGKPKGVPILHHALAGVCASWAEVMGFGPSIRAPQVATPAFDVSILETWPLLVAGGCLVIPPADVLRTPDALQSWMLDARLDTAFIPTPLLAPLLDLTWPQATSLTHIGTGGDRLPARPSADLPFQLINAYGPTECTIVATAGVLATADVDPGPPDIGRPVAGTHCHLLDGHLQPAPFGVEAELYLSGPRITPGYLNRPAQTAAAFVTPPFDPTLRLYRTGDRVSLRPDGRIAFIGRSDHQVKVRGVRIELAEIEAALMANEAVAAAVGYVDTDGVLRAAVEPATALSADTAALKADWQLLYETLYGEAADADTADWDLKGWQSSLTGAPIPAADMRDWANGTARRLAGFGAQAILEIGCGTGLILQALAPFAARYQATDFAAASLHAIRRRQAVDPRLAHVTVTRQEANDFAGVEDRAADLVILNSIAQYFPSLAYLDRVLDQAVAATEDGGRVFVGDVRNLALLDLFHAEAALARLPAQASLATWRATTAGGLLHEDELVIDPRYFSAYASRNVRVQGVQVQPRSGGGDSEMARYRYDVILHVGGLAARRAVSWCDDTAVSLEMITRAAAGTGWRRVRNRRLTPLLALREWLTSAPDAANTVGDLRDHLAAVRVDGVDPDALIGAAESSWLDADPDGAFAVVTGTGEPAAFGGPTTETGRSLATDPLAAHARRQLADALRSDLQSRLPNAFVPTQISVVDRFPRSPAGKIDRQALMGGGAPRRPAQIIPPSTKTEHTLVEIWREVLGASQIGVTDDFFALGGHSLSTTRVISRIQSRLGHAIPLSALFERPTVRTMGDYLDGLTASHDGSSAPGPFTPGRSAGAPTAPSADRDRGVL